MTSDFDRAKSLFLEGVSLFEAGHMAEAEQALSAALQLMPGRASILGNLGAVRLALARPRDALPVLEQAVAADPENLQAWCHRATALAQLGRLEDALASDDRALALDPSCAPAWYHRGRTLLALQRHDQARLAFEKLVTLVPDNAEAWLLHSGALARALRLDDALESIDRCLALAPDLGVAWSRRGMMLRQQQRPREAAEAFERAIALGDEVEMNRYFLASVSAGEMPLTAPRAYVENLFDDYADEFDRHLVDILGYQAPKVLIEQLQAQVHHRFARAIDLGCGTGLCGPLLRPFTGHLEGVDLSGRMVEKARQRGVYDAVVQADVVEHLAALTERPDLVVAADVFIYLGDLDPVFAGVAKQLLPGGVFCFTVELAAQAEGFELQASLTYAHSEAYLRTLAHAHGFEVLDVLRQPVRHDQRHPIDGLYMVLRTSKA